MPIRVLLVDDHAIVRDGLALLLCAAPDIEVVASLGGGRAAIRAAAELLPDIAIVDLDMPELNGIETTRQLLDASPSTEVLILSMHASREYVFQALIAGAHGYLLKESAGTEVVTAVRTVFAGKRYTSARFDADEIDRYLRGRNPTNPLDLLSARERQVLQLVAEGLTSVRIAALVTISPKSVDTYRSRIMRKLGIDDLAGLVKFAIRHGLTSLE